MRASAGGFRLRGRDKWECFPPRESRDSGLRDINSSPCRHATLKRPCGHTLSLLKLHLKGDGAFVVLRKHPPTVIYTRPSWFGKNINQLARAARHRSCSSSQHSDSVKKAPGTALGPNMPLALWLGEFLRSDRGRSGVVGCQTLSQRVTCRNFSEIDLDPMENQSAELKQPRDQSATQRTK